MSNDRTIYFSNFSNSGKLENAIAISRTVPRWYRGARMIEVAPTMSAIRRFKRNQDGQWQWFIEHYITALYDRFDLEELCEQSIGNVPLCHCKRHVLCHRILLAKTFEIEFGVTCRELGGWSIPFNKAFEKMDRFVDIFITDEHGNEINAVGHYKELLENLPPE